MRNCKIQTQSRGRCRKCFFQVLQPRPEQVTRLRNIFKTLCRIPPQICCRWRTCCRCRCAPSTCRVRTSPLSTAAKSKPFCGPLPSRPCRVSHDDDETAPSKAYAVWLEPPSASSCTYPSLAYSAQPFLNLHLLSRSLLQAYVWFIRISVHRLQLHQCVLV